MQVKVILLLGVLLLGTSLKRDHIFRASSQTFKRVYSGQWKPQSKRLSEATQMGKKLGLKKEIKENLKNFGLIHLLTPSGIHLASLTVIFKRFLPRSFFKVLIFLFAITLNILGGYYSLKRICYFVLLKDYLPNAKISFFGAFFIDILLGGFENSSLSFSLSFIFWGVILFSSKGMLSIILNLFMAQCCVSMLFQAKISYLSLIINPILTSSFTFFFPLLSFQYWTNASSLLESFARIFYNSFAEITMGLNYLDFSLFYPSAFLFALILLHSRRNIVGLFIIYLVFNHTSLNESSQRMRVSGVYYKDDTCKLSFINGNHYKRCRGKKRTKKKPDRLARLL